MDALVERVVADHRRRRRRGGRREREGDEDDDHRDFVDVLLDVNEAEEQTTGGGGVLFDDAAIKAMVLVMLVAATDTTYTTLVWAMAELVNHPNEMRRVQDEVRAAFATGGGGVTVTEDHLDEMRYLKCVIKETLRLHGPVPLLLPRETTEDTQLLGYHVPARTRVIVNAWAIARDLVAWERPEEFVPERWFAAGDDYMFAQDFRLVPFGAGRRGCPGVAFAVPSMELALASLLYHFDWELPTGGASKLEMDEVNGLSVHLKATLHLLAKQWPR